MGLGPTEPNLLSPVSEKTHLSSCRITRGTAKPNQTNTSSALCPAELKEQILSSSCKMIHRYKLSRQQKATKNLHTLEFLSYRIPESSLSTWIQWKVDQFCT